jgi:hypothetical protein
LASDGNWYPPHQQPGYQQAGYQQAGYQYGYQPFAQPSAGTNGFAVASLVLGILWIWWIGSALAVVFGHIALGQLKARPQGGRGLAIAGLILGYIGLALLALGLIGLAAGGDDIS